MVAGVVGSYADNLTMSLGAGALIAPIAITDATSFRAPYLVVVALMICVLVVSMRSQSLRKSHAPLLLFGCGAFVAVALLV